MGESKPQSVEKRILPRWCKDAKIAMIENDMSVNELAERAGISREYASAVINGRIYSQASVRTISDVLNIVPSSFTLR